MTAAIRALMRWVAAAIVAVVLSVGPLCESTVGRGEAPSSANPFATLGLPEIAVTVTNDAFEGVPANLAAGRYVLSVTNEYSDSSEETAGAALLMLPENVIAEDFIALVADEDSAWPPEWYYQTSLAGGAYAPPGETAYAVIDLPAGDWMLWSEGPGAPQAPVPISVGGAPTASQPTPSADLSVDLSEFHFGFSAPLQSGPRVVEVVNSGQQPHFLFIGGVPADATVADAQAAFAAFWDPDSAPPPPFSFAESPEYVGTGDQSAGTTAWYAIDVPPGTVVVACFVTDPESGEPHAMLGMTEILTVD